MEALFVPFPLAKRWGDVIRNWARYKAEHFKDILHGMDSKGSHDCPNCRGEQHYKHIRGLSYPGVLICSQKSMLSYVYNCFFPARGDNISWSSLTKSDGRLLLDELVSVRKVGRNCVFHQSKLVISIPQVRYYFPTTKRKSNEEKWILIHYQLNVYQRDTIKVFDLKLKIRDRCMIEHWGSYYTYKIQNL